MTLETPIHIQGIDTPREGHLIEPSVTSDTPDSLVNMNTMIEIDKAGEVMNSGPLDRLTGSKTVPDRRQHGAVGPDLGMTVHAGFRRRDAGERTFLDGRMAVAAIDTVIANMMFVTERHGLAARHADLCDVG